MISLYNTLTRKKEQFKPLHEGKVHIYMCGPTVYDYFHVGNARSFVNSDIIRRYFEYAGYEVIFAMNLTDIDDKIINKANAEGKRFDEISSTYSEAFFEDIAKLRIKRATINPKATEHISDIVSMIEKLEKNNIAYNVDGDVFYAISKFDGYGKLSGKHIDELEAGSRVDVVEQKANPLDFALWKKAKPGEPAWESPWGKGRPGWHIECSAMSCKHLGENFDIHMGGSDLIFPHHENEIAQSEGANGKPFVNYWMHFGFLNIDNEKMSKSLGNFFTARDILKIYSAEALRFFYAMTHYSAPLNFTQEAIEAAAKGLEKIHTLYFKAKEEMAKENSGETPDFSSFRAGFAQAMDDDFNSPKALAVLFDFIKEVNKAAAQGPQSKEYWTEVFHFLSQTADGVLGIIPDEKQSTASDNGLEDKLIKLLIALRVQAKAEKNYGFADSIRKGMQELGITLTDTKEGTTYKKS